ncbi:hypothetical protein D3C87_2101040 [compost metagenome]
MIHQAILQGAHQQVDPLPAEALPLRLIGQLLQWHPVREGIPALQLNVLQRETGLFAGELKAAEEAAWCL